MSSFEQVGEDRPGHMRLDSPEAKAMMEYAMKIVEESHENDQDLPCVDGRTRAYLSPLDVHHEIRRPT